MPCGLLDLAASDLRAVGAALAQGGAFRLALAAQPLSRAFRGPRGGGGGGLWQLGSLVLDHDRGHNPIGIFAAVEIESIASLAVSNFRAAVFSQLSRWTFGNLRTLQVSDCVFEAVGAQAVVDLSSKGCGLRSLVIHRCFLGHDDVARLVEVASSGSLRRLSIWEVGLDVHLEEPLAQLVASSQIEDLSLRGNFRLAGQLAGVLGHHRYLRSLSLTGNAQLSDTVVCQLCEQLVALGSSCLATLDLSAAGTAACLSDAAGAAVAAALAAGVPVAYLNFSGQKMTKASLAACLAAGACLRKVDFSSNVLGGTSRDEQLLGAMKASAVEILLVGAGTSVVGDGENNQGLLSSLRWIGPVMPNLKVLDASAACISDTALAELATAMAATPRVALRSLNLSANFLSEEGVLSLLSGLQHGNACLETLDLGINLVGDVGCRAIADALHSHAALAHLRSLSLRANAIANISRLLQAIPSSALQYLDLRENLLTDDDVRSLSSSFRSSNRRFTCLVADNLAEELGGSEELGPPLSARAQVSTAHQELDHLVESAYAPTVIPQNWPLGGSCDFLPHESATASSDVMVKPQSHKTDGEDFDGIASAREGEAIHLPPTAHGTTSARESEAIHLPLTAQEWQEDLEFFAWMQSQLK